MKALLIDPEKKSLEPIEIQGRDDIVKLIGYDTIESDAVGPAPATVCISTRSAFCAAPKGVSRSTA